MVAATNQHYDVDARVFEHFLGATMKYSAGIFESDDDTLDIAQERKLDFIAGLLGVEAGGRVLDVGCGWGSLTIHLASRFASDVVAVTPAPLQAEYVRRRAEAVGVADRVRVVIGEYPDVVADGAFDGAALVGSIAHMTDRHLDVLRQVRASLTPHGALYLSESCYRSAALREKLTARSGARFVRDEIFGAGDLEPLSMLIATCEASGLVVSSVHDLTRHYAKTIERWQENIRGAAEAIDAIEQGLADRLLHYLDIGNAGWHFAAKHYAIVARRR